MPEFDVIEERLPGSVRLLVTGELDLASAPELESTIRHAWGCGNQVVLDLSVLEFMDSTGLRSLVVLQGEAQREGWQLDFAERFSPTVDRLFDMVGMKNVLADRRAGASL